MKPQINNKLIKKAHYKYAWYKSMVRMLRNKRVRDFKNEQTIHLS